MPDSGLSLSPPEVRQVLMSLDVLALIADSVICTDEDGRILLFNRAAEQSFGYSASEVIGEHVNILLPQRHRADHVHQVRSLAREESPVNRLMGSKREVWGRRKSGEEFPVEASVSRQTIDGNTILTVVHRDISERKQLDEQREAIAGELDHRTRNVLSVVSSLISLSARTATSVSELRDSLLQRVRSLAATQTLLKRDTRGRLTLNELLLAELAHYRDPDGVNIIIEGEPVALNPTAIQPLALAVHELATNSAKYGALSAPGGRVAIKVEGLSERDESLLLIQWRESGGPPVKPPDRRGFGSKFIEQVIERAFHADVSVEYRPEGLVCHLKLPRARVEEVPGEAPGTGRSNLGEK